MLMLVKGFWKGLLDYWDPRSDGIASMEILTFCSIATVAKDMKKNTF